jgi:hypothetical protein
VGDTNRMARPQDNEFRTALLGALDKKLLSSLGDINEHLKSVGQFKSYQSTRRMLIRMEQEGLVSKHPTRLQNNQVQYSKRVVSPHLVLRDLDGNIVDLARFIHSVFNAKFPEIVDPKATVAIKQWMFDYIVASDPKRYAGIRETPDRRQLKKKLQGTLLMLQDMHMFIKHFMDSDVHSPVAEAKLARELNECPNTQIELIVNQQWSDYQ